VVLVTGDNDPASPSSERNPLDQLAEIRITVRLPGELMADGRDTLLSHYTVLNPEQVRMQDLETTLPVVLERLNTLLCASLAFP
jgi:hypothetical protein